MTEKSIKKLKDLTHDDLNSNLGSERGTQMIEDSLRSYGAGRSIVVDKHGKIISGNHVAEAAGSIGMEDLIVVPSDGKKLVVVMRTDLDMEDPLTREAALADNRAAELDITHDSGVLAQLEDLGVKINKFFTGGELEIMAQNFGKEDGGKKTGPVDGDPIKCPACSHEFIPPKGEKKTRMGLRERIARAHPQQGQQ